jgi:hypothetical protein
VQAVVGEVVMPVGTRGRWLCVAGAPDGVADAEPGAMPTVAAMTLAARNAARLERRGDPTVDSMRFNSPCRGADAPKADPANQFGARKKAPNATEDGRRFHMA